VRNIPGDLYDHLQEDVTTTCRLLKITLQDGTSYGLCSLNKDIVYEGVTYSALNGYDPAIIATNGGMTVDNSEAVALLSADISGITLEMALAGALDDATWEMLLINWADTSQGHIVLDAGDIGEVKVVNDMVYIPEIISFSMRLKQSIGGVWSRRCRAVFGTDASSQTGCGVDADSMWVAGEVTSVGDEPKRVFADSSISVSPAPVPGRVRWLTGKNASSRLYQVEGFSSVSGTIALLEPTPFIIEVGDEFEIRKDCNKSPSDCTSYGNLINYKGEPYIPVGDGLESQTPGAQVFGGLSGSEVID
jgi:uncharacterized phage protein (TIGR02218 family)